MTDPDQNGIQLNIDYHVSTVDIQVNNDLISKMQYYLYCVDNCIPERHIPQIFVDHQDNIFPRDKFKDFVTYFFDYLIFMMVESGLFWVSNEVHENELVNINEGTDIEKMLLNYGIKAKDSKIQELRKISKKLIL
jgi:hypothetical protein